MKLRSGKIVSMDVDSALQQLITIRSSVNLELKKTIDTLKFLLKDDLPFLKKIVESSLLLGKGVGVYSNDIDALVLTKYCDRTPGGHDTSLLYTAFDLGRLIFGNHPFIRKELSKLPVKSGDLEKWKIVQQTLRTEIEQEVSNMFLESDLKESSINMIGDSEQSYNEMEI